MNSNVLIGHHDHHRNKPKQGNAMYKALTLALSMALIPAVAMAAPPAEKKAGIESKDYKWNAQEGEKIEALKLKGDAKAGKEGYEVCGACHLPSGAGRPDGTFPQLAGQHTTVLIKQMADIRAGLRDNPTMYPFAKELTDAQELANVSAYIESLCIPSTTASTKAPMPPSRLPTARPCTRRSASSATRPTVKASRTSSTRCSPASTTSTCCAR
jgi:cytochrome c553